MSYEVVESVWVELSDVPDALEQKGVSELCGSSNQLVELSVSSEHVCVALVGRQVDSQCNQLLAHNRLRTVNDQLVDQGDAVCVRERGFGLVLETQVVQQLDDLRPKARCFQSVNELWDHALVIHLDSDFLVEGQVVQSAQGNLQQQLVVARNKTI